LQGDELKIKSRSTKQDNTENKIANDSSLHSEAIKENLDNVNMDPWYYIYENYVNPNPKKNED